MSAPNKQTMSQMVEEEEPESSVVESKATGRDKKSSTSARGRGRGGKGSVASKKSKVSNVTSTRRSGRNKKAEATPEASEE